MNLSTTTRHGPEISDAIVSFDPITLERKPVKKADVLDLFQALGNHAAVNIVRLLIFGPFTLIRPTVVLAGAVWGVTAAPNAITIALTVLVVTLMLDLESALGWLRSRALIS